MSSIDGCGFRRSAGSFLLFMALCLLAGCGGGGGGTTGTANNNSTVTPSNESVGTPGNGSTGTTNDSTGPTSNGGTGTTGNDSTNVSVQASGSTLYQANCQGCHQPLASSTKLNKTAAEIQAAITANTGGMGSLATLSAGEIQSIADALKTTEAIPSFNTTNSDVFQLNGSAVLSNNNIRLTPNEQYTAGSAFLANPFTLGSNFVFNAYFNFTLGAGGRSNRHADGFVFALQTVSSKAGATGGNLGFGGIKPSFGVEFDTFKNDGNNDPDNNHVAIVTNGSVQHAAFAPVTPSVTMSDGGTYHVWIDYDGATVEVHMNTTNDRSTSSLLLAKAIDLKSIFSTQYVYFGFTGATGIDSQTQDVGAFYLTSNYQTGGFSPAP
ncbi:lectin-like domain-containing protein [Geotalea toluenoxydans]|uniref:lectin-like domain-containing protein n=1 Tax=Geotalea toluenoxydans TaxID=421624 RepID=UPI0006D1F2AC|nr:c-type cytochrome [Geotalea toluenoxydans]